MSQQTHGFRFFVGGTAKFFGVEVETLASSEQCWWERRRRLAIKRFGGVKDEFLDGGGNAYNTQVCSSVCLHWEGGEGKFVQCMRAGWRGYSYLFLFHWKNSCSWFRPYSCNVHFGVISFFLFLEAFVKRCTPKPVHITGSKYIFMYFFPKKRFLLPKSSALASGTILLRQGSCYWERGKGRAHIPRRVKFLWYYPS